MHVGLSETEFRYRIRQSPANSRSFIDSVFVIVFGDQQWLGFDAWRIAYFASAV